MRFSFGNSSTARFPEKSSMNISRLVEVVFFKIFKFLYNLANRNDSRNFS